VLDVISDVHPALAVEDDAVAGALARQLDEDLALAIGSNSTDGLLAGKVDSTVVAVGIASRSFDAGSEGVLSGQRCSDEKLLFVVGMGQAPC
jgi:hypothetical protein